MKNEGREELLSALRDSLTLAEQNPCKASDTTMMAIAKTLKALLTSELTFDLSREKAARYLGMSTRTLGRKVADGTVPKPERKGHKALSFSALKLAKLFGKH